MNGITLYEDVSRLLHGETSDIGTDLDGQGVFKDCARELYRLPRVHVNQGLYCIWNRQAANAVKQNASPPLHAPNTFSNRARDVSEKTRSILNKTRQSRRSEQPLASPGQRQGAQQPQNAGPANQQDSGEPTDDLLRKAMVEIQQREQARPEKIANWRRTGFLERESYRQIKVLGHGGNGKCFLVERKGANPVYRACKVTRGVYPLSKANEAATQDERRRLRRRIKHRRDLVLNEVNVLLGLPLNDRIVEFYYHSESPKQCQLYFEYCDGGDLTHLMRRYGRQKIPETFLWHCFLQLSQGLAYIHQGFDYRLGPRSSLPKNWHPLIHADLKPDNVLLRRKAGNCYPDLVLADFGAAQSKPGGFGGDAIGTLCWQPPEVPEWSTAGDIWALGAIMGALGFQGFPPVKGLEPWFAELPQFKDMPSTHIDQQWNMRSDVRCWRGMPRYTKELADRVEDCLNWHPEDRPTAHEIMRDVWAEMVIGIMDAQLPLMDEWWS